MSASTSGIEVCCNMLLLCVTCFTCYSKVSRKRKNENIQKEQREQLEQTQRRLQNLERRQRQRELEDIRRNRANNAVQLEQVSAPPLSSIASSTFDVADLSESNRLRRDGINSLYSSSNSPPDYEDVVKSEPNNDVIGNIAEIKGDKKEISFEVEVKATDRRKSF